jgi:putative DNA primase/helicase
MSANTHTSFSDKFLSEINPHDGQYVTAESIGEGAANFYHSTLCTFSSKDRVCVNTHRTDFVGYKQSNKAFNVIARSIHHPSGALLQAKSDIDNLRDLADSLIKKQGDAFYLNEYPEECEHLQYIDIDANINDELLDYIIVMLKELATEGAEVLVLRSTSSGKVHLIMNVPAFSRRGSLRKKAISRWLCEHLYEAASVGVYEYTKKQWREDVFDARAPGIRSALSAKVEDGELIPNKGVYAPPDIDVSGLYRRQKVEIVLKYSIYNEPGALWTDETLEEFARAEKELEAEVAAKKEARAKTLTANDYNAEKKTINVRGADCTVNCELINGFIKFLPSFWAGKTGWGITLKNVKAAALLTEDFDPHYFLHEWSAQDEKMYNENGNNRRYNKCKADISEAGAALTWLKNIACASDEITANLYRGDYGLALIFKNLAGDKIKIVSKDGTCYLWDDDSRLWEYHDVAWIGNEVSVKLEVVYENQISLLTARWEAARDEEAKKNLEKQIGALKQRKERIMDYRPAMDVVHKARRMLTDKGFIERINLQHDLLPIKGGLVVDLRTGETAPRLQSHNFTFECPVSIDRDTERRELVEQFMLDICCGDKALLRYFQIALGYCITGHTKEKVFFVWWGARDNGKSTIIKLLGIILGGYYDSSSKCLFVKTKSDSKLSPEKEVLGGRRLVSFSETGADDELNDEVIKMATGDDAIRVNPKFRDEYTIKSFAKLIIATNHKPKINVNDAAMVCRVKFIPFLTKFVDNPKAPDERKRNVPLALRMETDLLDAFFTWILDGAICWSKSGLVDIPTVMQKATADFMAENDELGEFLEEETEPGPGIGSTALYNRYLEWSRARNITKPKGLKTFSQEIEKRPGVEREKKRGISTFTGLKFREKDAEDNHLL